jgi:hypothetical protein
MTTEQQLTEDVVVDIETWERRVHPAVRQWEHLMRARSLGIDPSATGSQMRDAGAAWAGLAGAYARYSGAVAALPFAWLDPSVLPGFWQAQQEVAEGYRRAWQAFLPANGDEGGG